MSVLHKILYYSSSFSRTVVRSAVTGSVLPVEKRRVYSRADKKNKAMRKAEKGEKQKHILILRWEDQRE